MYVRLQMTHYANFGALLISKQCQKFEADQELTIE
jgi:hypothetical protein